MNSRRRGLGWWIGRRLGHIEVVRILLRDRLFTSAFAIVGLIAVLIALSLPKIWRTTPADFPGATVKVSWIDLIQAKSLARSARKAAREEDWEAALHASRGALANNLGNPRLHRDLLQLLRSAPQTDLASPALLFTSSSWLLALGRTNQSDLTLIADVLEKYGAPTMALAFLDRRRDADSPSITAARARCLLSAGKYRPFGELWKQHADQWASSDSNSVMTHYVDAWLAATDSETEGIEALERLRASSSQNAPSGLTAARLLHQVAGLRRRIDDLNHALARLEKAGAASATHHAVLWLALMEDGRVEEARRMAADYDKVPQDPDAAARYVGALNALQLSPRAVQFLEANIQRYGHSPAIWRAYFDVLARERRWTDLQRLAGSLRAATGRQEVLFPDIVFAEYRAAHSEGRRRDADALARELIGLDFTQPDAALAIAGALRASGQPERARELLKANEVALDDDPEFWMELFGTARDLGDVDELRRASEGFARVSPESPLVPINRAAILLITGDDPAEALQLTFAALTRQPNSYALAINHAIALVRNGRAAEADRLLTAIPTASLPPEAVSNHGLALAEVREAQGRWADVLRIAPEVDRSRLLQPQIDRLDRIIARARREL
jgi:thioredoxin-like negative regulator of GroEL